MNPVRWHAAARLELVKAVDFYEGESVGLGEIFLRSVEVALDTVIENPSLGPRVLGEVRCKLVRRFPYSLFYRFDGSLYILAVAHQKRRPRYWADRL